MNNTGKLGGIVAMLIVLIVCVMGVVKLSHELSRTNSGMGGIYAPHIVGQSAMAQTVLIQSKITEVEVGTNWYDPNTEMLQVHIWGHPMVPNVKWEVRYNYDNRTVTTMPPINSPKKTFVEFKGKNLDALEYRICPNQLITKCRFRFRFDPPSK